MLQYAKQAQTGLKTARVSLKRPQTAMNGEKFKKIRKKAKKGIDKGRESVLY